MQMCFDFSAISVAEKAVDGAAGSAALAPGAATPAAARDLARVRRGELAWHSGRAAEEQVAWAYRRRGYHLVATRWRCAAGEIDLILRRGRLIVFVEVKRSHDFRAAAERLQGRQITRICRAAECYLSQEGSAADVDARIDVALVDGVGRIDMIEGALFADA